jgi:hypothetical protein
MRRISRSAGFRIASAVAILFVCLTVGARTQAPAGESVATLHFPKNPKQTVGVNMSLDEVSRTKGGRYGTKVEYQVTSSGFPSGKTYQLKVSSLSISKPATFLTAVRADDSGALVTGVIGKSGTSAKVPNVMLTVEDYNKGEFYMAEVVSDDGSVYAVDRVHPFPIEANDRSCHVWAELLKKDRKQFLILGSGFGADTDVRTVSSEGDGTDLIDRTERVGAGDLFVVQVVHRKSGGTGTFVATGQQCKVTLQYDFGRQAKGPE